jgi:hypothetical protein
MDKSQSVDKKREKVSSLATSLKDLTEQLQPVLEMEAHDQYERELWNRYGSS